VDGWRPTDTSLTCGPSTARSAGPPTNKGEDEIVRKREQAAAQTLLRGGPDGGPVGCPRHHRSRRLRGAQPVPSTRPGSGGFASAGEHPAHGPQTTVHAGASDRRG